MFYVGLSRLSRLLKGALHVAARKIRGSGVFASGSLRAEHSPSPSRERGHTYF